MTKSKITTATLTALALAGTLAATSGSARSSFALGRRRRHRHCGRRIDRRGCGDHAYGGPVYVAPAYRECRLVERYDRWGNLRVVQVCGY